HGDTLFMVRLEDGNSKQHSEKLVRGVDLKYGDEVLAFDQSTNQLVYSPIVAFTVFSPDGNGKGKEILFENSTDSLRLSDIHLVYASIDGKQSPDFYQAQFITDKSIMFHEGFKVVKVKEVREFYGVGWVSP